MSDHIYEQKTQVWRLPEGGTTSGSVLVELPSMRDQFAMAALTGLLSSSRTMGTREGYCKGAYEFADAMLAARKESQ